MELRRDDQHLAIVALGLFNPPIFQPAWMAAEGLLRPGDAETVQVEIVHQEAAVFSTGWFRCEVTRDRFSLRTGQESHYLPVRDLMCGIFAVLKHTPISAFGVNHTEVVQFPDRSSFDAFGWRLVPPDRWASLNRPGMARLEEQGDRTDDNKGWIRVRVEPILDDSYRVVLEVNDHFAFGDARTGATPSAEVTSAMVRMLVDEWQEVSKRAGEVLAELKEWADESG